VHIHDEIDHAPDDEPARVLEPVGAFGAPTGNGIDALDGTPIPEEWAP
jgi:hypothetical protein